MNKRRKIKNEIYNDSWIYTMLLTTLVILLESLKTYTFKIGTTNLTLSLFLLPLVYLITNYISKKYDYKKAVSSISISGVAMVIYVAIVSFIVRDRFVLNSITGDFCGYVASQFVNLTIYEFIMNNTRQHIVLIYLNYVFSLIINYLFYTLIYLNLVIIDDFWSGYFMTLVIQSLILIPIALIDKKIKRGRDIK